MNNPKIKKIKISELIPDANNANLGTERGRAMLERSIQDLGFGRSLVLDKHGRIIAGNKSHEVAGAVGLDNVLVIETDGTQVIAVQRTDLDLLSDDKAKLLAIADNRTGEISLNWNSDIILDLSDEIDLGGFFTNDELLSLSLNPEEDDGGTGGGGSGKRRSKDDAVNPDEVELRVKVGDLVLMGKHRLIVGDCTDPDVIARLMDGKKAAIAITDPPYNVDYDPEQRHSTFSEERLNNPLGKIKNDVMTDTDFRAFLDKVYSQIDASLDPGCPIYIFHADTMGHHFRNAFVAQPWKMQSCLIWKKTVLVFGRADYHWMHEPVLYGWKEGASHRYYGDRKQTTIVECPTPHYDKDNCDTKGYVHPTQKPTLILETFINNSSQDGDIVIDLFGGSGSTLIACEATNRACFTTELDPRFASAIVKRWEEFTGKTAKIVPLEISVPANLGSDKEESLLSLGF